MFLNHIKIALRNLQKNKGFALINILGLATGLTIFIFGTFVVRYEKTHDAFFENSERTYIIGSVASPNLNIGVSQFDATWSAVGPIMRAEFADIEAIARTEVREHLVAVDDRRFYQSLRAADPDLLQIFDLTYLAGDSSGLDEPSDMAISEAAAIKYFGRSDVLGEVVTLDNEHEFFVSAVFADVPKNSHFNSRPISDSPMDVIIPTGALERIIDGYDVNGAWEDLSIGNMTYVMLPASLDEQWLQTQLDEVYDRHFPEATKDVVSSLYTRPLETVNVGIWDSFGLPIIAVIQLLGIMVLIIACVNYTNLATAQALGRSREVGMRKTMGASQAQLLTQFLVESVVITLIAMLVAVACLEVLIPIFNNSTDKVMQFDYLATLPWMVLTALAVGLLAGAYPAWLITRATPIDALRDLARKGKKGSVVRSLMIGAQFALSTFMLGMVAVVYMQNLKVEESSHAFPRTEIFTLSGVDDTLSRQRRETLQRELIALPGVSSASYSSQVPFQQSNSTAYMSATPGDEAGRFQIQWLRMSPEFPEVYDIQLLAGRQLSDDIAGDEWIPEESESVNVIVNEMLLEQLGIASPADALNRRFYDLSDENTLRDLVIVGVAPTQNIVGLVSPEKAWVYVNLPAGFQYASVRLAAGSNMLRTVEEIEAVWDRVVPEFPMQGKFLDETFDDSFSILRYMSIALAAIAGIALLLTMTGLFGLAAFIAAQRTKEIGVRKVLGASVPQIARLLIWQLSKPVAWALAVSLPLAYFATNTYLDFFAERISPFGILLVAGVVAVLLAWATVAGHAIRIARSNPIHALRYD